MGQGFKVAGFHSCKGPNCRVPGLQGSKIPSLHSSWHHSPSKRLKPNRIVVGRFLRLHCELCLQFPHVQTLWTIETQPTWSILREYCLNLVKECSGFVCVHIGQNIKGTTNGWLPKCCVYIAKGMHKWDSEGWHCPLAAVTVAKLVQYLDHPITHFHLWTTDKISGRIKW